MKEREIWLQLDDVWMSQQAHVFEFPANPGLHYIAMDSCLGEELHGDLVAGDGVYGH